MRRSSRYAYLTSSWVEAWIGKSSPFLAGEVRRRVAAYQMKFETWTWHWYRLMLAESFMLILRMTLWSRQSKFVRTISLLGERLRVEGTQVGRCCLMEWATCIRYSKCIFILRDNTLQAQAMTSGIPTLEGITPLESSPSHVYHVELP